MFGDEVRALRLRLGMTQEQLAEASGAALRTIRKIETGRVAAPRSSTVRLLADAFGLQGTERDRFHESILGSSDPSRDRAPDPSRDLSPVPAPPRQLPAPPRLFTGRGCELGVLDGIHDSATVVIAAIDGMAGVGKTALALHAAHRIADRYPDGQLFIDLHGFSDTVTPVAPGEALDRLLRALGIPGERVPAELDDRAGLWRSALAERRMLIVLDNAAAEAQVAPLLPGAPGCLVLVTSRRMLAGLEATRTLSLDMLPLPEAVSLLTRTAGPGRFADQPPGLAAEIAELCGRLPLAIRIAAARLQIHPMWSPVDLARRLRDHRLRLAELEAGERSVTAALELSYQELPADQRRAYRLLGLHPGPDLDVFAAAALTGTTEAELGRLLDPLLQAHLLQEPAIGRYVWHDLVRAHAVRAATRDAARGGEAREGARGGRARGGRVRGGAASGRRAALGRLLDHYRYTASEAMNTAYPYERGRRPDVPRAHTPAPDVADPVTAIGWLDTELTNLLAAVRLAADRGWPEHVRQLSAILHRHLRTRGRNADAEAVHRRALATARAAGDRAGELDALQALGWVRQLSGRHEQAVDDFTQALATARALGNRAGEGEALIGLGHLHWLQGRSERALVHLEQALAVTRAAGDRVSEADALRGLADAYGRQGRHELALDHYRQSLAVARATGHRICELNALTGLGHLHRVSGRFAPATSHHLQALEIATAMGHRTAELSARFGLGDVHRWQGRYPQAADCYRQALEIAREVGNPNWEFEALHGLGRLYHATGRLDAARTHHLRALALANQLAQPDDQARAHDGLAHTHRSLGEPAHARRHWQRVLEILVGLGVDHTEGREASVSSVRDHLAEVARSGDVSPAGPPAVPSAVSSEREP